MPLGQLPTRNPICGARWTTSVNLWERLLNARQKPLFSGPADNRWRSATSMPEVAQKVSIQVRVNGKLHSREIEPRLLLVEFIREDLELTGPHVGCDTTYSGAFTVLMNGAPAKSSTVFAVQADGAEITTVEGLEKDGELHPIQKAFVDCY